MSKKESILSDDLRFDFLVRLKFNLKDSNYHKAGIRTAYNDFARTLKDFEKADLHSKKVEMEAFLLSELKKFIALDIKNQEEFDEKHEAVCHKIKEKWNPLTYGQIQKWVNMSLKYWLLFGEKRVANIEKNARFFHIPIDSIIKKVAFGQTRHQKGYESWSKINDYEEYKALQIQFRQKFEGAIPIEKEFILFNESNTPKEHENE